MSLPIGLQLWSIKDETEKDFIGALKKVAEIGYQGVEFAGYGNLTSKELKATLDDLGLKPSGSHVPLEHILEDLNEVIRFNLEIGNKYIICPYANFENKEDFLSLASKLKEASEKCKSHGLIVGYHNHNHEFVKYDDNFGLDIILDNTPNTFISELDVYWVQHAGINPVEYIEKHNGRFELIHIKDMEIVNGEKRSTEIGNGIINMNPIIEAAEAQGAKWLVIEQEFFTKPCLESVKEGFDYLNSLINS